MHICTNIYTHTDVYINVYTFVVDNFVYRIKTKFNFINFHFLQFTDYIRRLEFDSH